ncbi:MAG: DNA gyrase subunit A [Clostridia bacterium]|nr:DNA gyrase subunit A [Clostridia bacterium]
MAHETYDYSAHADQKILDVELEKELKKSFIDYAMSVIVSRALPDVRDGLKPGQRRIMYAMYEDHLTSDHPFQKSATTVGNVLGRYHPHGDSAVYDTMVRMAQSFVMRYPLVEGHGNFGNIDGDEAAAYRYTEARMSKMASALMLDIDKDVVNFVPNFDNRLREPEVLPSRFPNLLVNGSVGIAVGMATNIPPHNLCEVIDGAVYLMDHPDATCEELMQFVKGPDFPTGAIICGTSGIKDAYSTGKGRIIVRSRAEINEEKHQIIITEIPYQVNKAMLVESIANLHKEKRVEGIKDLKDVSGKNGMKIIVEYSQNANGEVILNQLYKYTQLQDTCAVNMLAIVDGAPKILNLKEMLSHYISHQQSVFSRRTKFDLEKALAREHILEGQMRAIEDIDRVIEIIRASDSVANAKTALIEAFGLTDIQAQAIVDMTLGKLAGLERIKIEDELAEKRALIEELRSILSDESKLTALVKDAISELKTKFGDERKTEIAAPINDIDLEDMIEKHDCVITTTRSGYVKRLPADTYSAQHRGGKGITGMTTKESDLVENVMVVHSHSSILMFTNTGKVFVKKAYQIPEAGRTAKGTNIVNILELSENEKVTAAIAIDDFCDGSILDMITKKGVIKRCELSEFEYQRRGGKIAIDLDEGDELIYMLRTDCTKHIVIATKEGNAVRFDENDARLLGRNARGVRGIQLHEGDEVAGVAIVDDSKVLVTITENGYGKRSAFDEFACRSRGTIGVCCHTLSEKTGRLCGIAAVSDDDDLMMITDDGIIIRTSVEEIPVYRRSASGVIVMRLSEGAKVVNFAVAKKQDEDDGEGEGDEETPETAESPETASEN